PNSIGENRIVHVFVFEDSLSQLNKSLQTMRSITDSDVAGPSKDLDAVDCSVFCAGAPAFAKDGICQVHQASTNCRATDRDLMVFTVTSQASFLFACKIQTIFIRQPKSDVTTGDSVTFVDVLGRSSKSETLSSTADVCCERERSHLRSGVRF